MASIIASRTPSTTTTGQAGTLVTHPYTCNSCQVAFRNGELQRGHMRSDWHRYNLKRRVTSLPPIASEVFTEKVLQAQASSTAAATKAIFEKTCSACVRTYFSENAYQNHLGSHKHKTKLASVTNHDDEIETRSVISSTFSLGEPMVAENDADSDIEDKIHEVTEGFVETNLREQISASEQLSRNNTVKLGKEDSIRIASLVTATDGEISEERDIKHCLFCNLRFSSVSLNAAHMEKIHGMFIPERTYLVDLDGLIGSLQEKIYEYHECLYCGKLKPSVFGLQAHMRDKGHCKIPFFTQDEQLEIGEFYDFTCTYSDMEDESDWEDTLPVKKQRKAVKLGANRETKIDAGGGQNIGEDGWETDGSESSLDSTDLQAERINGYSPDEYRQAQAVFYSEFELQLPSGRTAGHRFLNKYYKQNLRNHPSLAERRQLALEATASSSDEEQDERVAPRNERARVRALTSRANGGLGMAGVSAEKRKEVAATEKRSRRFEERGRRRTEWLVNKQNNSQRHFRDPLLQ